MRPYALRQSGASMSRSHTLDTWGCSSTSRLALGVRAWSPRMSFSSSVHAAPAAIIAAPLVESFSTARATGLPSLFPSTVAPASASSSAAMSFGAASGAASTMQTSVGTSLCPSAAAAAKEARADATARSVLNASTFHTFAELNPSEPLGARRRSADEQDAHVSFTGQ